MSRCVQTFDWCSSCSDVLGPCEKWWKWHFPWICWSSRHIGVGPVCLACWPWCGPYQTLGWVQVIWAYHLVFLGHWDDGSLLEAGGDYSLGQGQVEDVREHARQLVSRHWRHGQGCSFESFSRQPRRAKAPGRLEQRVFLDDSVLSASKRA